MIRIHTRNGLTEKLDLEDADQASSLLRRLADASFQASITAITVFNGETQHSLTRPAGFREVAFDAEHICVDEPKAKGADRIMVVADDVQVSVVLHKKQNAARLVIRKTGRQRFNPRLRAGGDQR